MTDRKNEILAYIVVKNVDGQYSIWRKDHAIPIGWHYDGMEGTKLECIAHIDQVWTDMRPRLRG
jgi:MbtH protein